MPPPDVNSVQTRRRKPVETRSGPSFHRLAAPNPSQRMWKRVLVIRPPFFWQRYQAESSLMETQRRSSVR